MVNTRTDADLSAAVQNALQTLFPQICAEIREEFCTSSGPSDAGGNPLPVTIHTWLERFNKQKPHSFEKATALIRLAVYKFEGNALAWWKAYKQAKGGDAWLITVTWADFKKLFFLQFFPRAEQERLKREYHSILQTSTETSTEFMQHFLRLARFLGAAAGTEEEQAKNFQWGLRRSTLNHLMCMSYTDVAQVANVARNYEILHERDDEDTERPDKRNSGNGRDQRNRGHQSNRSANSGSQQSRGPSEGYSYPVCTTCGRRHLGECRRSTGTCFKCGQAGHLQKECKKNTTASTSGQDDKKLGATGRVFAITEGHAANTSGTITGTLFIYGHAVFVLFDTGATHSVISSTFASRISTTPTLLDHVLSSPGVPLRATLTQYALLVDVDNKESVVELQADRKLGASGRVLAITEGQAANTSGFLATIHDTTSEIPSIHDQPIVIEFPDVFPDELLGIPPVRKVEFNIELIPGAEPISKAPYLFT
nr:hypothetical protein [Tanacetum cinerariifolium]